MKEGVSGYFDIPIGAFTVRLEYRETYGKKSIVAVRAYLKSSSYTGQWYPGGIITVDGQPVVQMNYNSPATHITNGNIGDGFKEIISFNGQGPEPPWESGEIAHNADGSKTVAISLNNFAVYRPSPYAFYNLGSVTRTIDLTKIGGFAHIVKDGQTVNASINIFTGGQFRQATPHIRKNGEWEVCV